MSATPAPVLEILKAAFSCDDERALRLAEEAGCTRFDLSQMRRKVAARGGTYEDGYDEGFSDAVGETMRAVENVSPPRRAARKAS